MKTRILTAVLFAAALVPVNASAHTRSIEIDTGNFDLSTQAGRDMLDAEAALIQEMIEAARLEQSRA